jgi:hypothetical protein
MRKGTPKKKVQSTKQRKPRASSKRTQVSSYDVHPGRYGYDSPSFYIKRPVPDDGKEERDE